MAGKQVPIVFIPRWSSLVGPGVFYYPPIPIAAYSGLVASIVFGNMLGTGPPSVLVDFQESTDLESWAACSAGTVPIPTAFVETPYSTDLTRAWLRVRVTSAGTNVAFSWCLAGSLILRER